MQKIKNILKLLRVHQYVKNLFILLPLFFVGQFTDVELVLDAFIAVIAFSLSASAVYVLNDLVDLKDDQQHPRKKHRPLASGKISKKLAYYLIAVFAISGLLLMACLSFTAFLIAVTYIVLNITYCVSLKHVSILDITIIAIGFILRLIIGSIVTGIVLSKWIIIMTFLLALFLALAKRRDDVVHFNLTGKKLRKVIDGYNMQFIDGAMVIMASVTIVSYILYTNSKEVVERIGSDYLYLTSIFVVLGILRYLQISFVEQESGSPTKIVMKDRFIILTLALWMSAFIGLIYC